MAQMLTIWRRHQKACPHTSRRERRCKCPVWVSGSLGGVQIKQALDTRSWDAAVGIVRDWEVTGRITTDEPETQIEISAACAKFTADAEARGLARSTIKKYRVLFDQLQEFAKDKGLRFAHQINLEWLRLFRESWRESNISALKKLERLRSACAFWVASGWIPENYASC